LEITAPKLRQLQPSFYTPKENKNTTTTQNHYGEGSGLRNFCIFVALKKRIMTEKEAFVTRHSVRQFIEKLVFSLSATPRLTSASTNTILKSVLAKRFPNG